VAQGRAPLMVELATVAERLRVAQEEVLAARQEADRLQVESNGWRRALDSSATERAALTERAMRSAVLEADASRAALQLRVHEEELRRLSGADAQKAERIEALKAEVDRLEREAGAQQAQRDILARSLHETSQRRAALEEQASRLPQLEEEVRQAKARAATRGVQLDQVADAVADSQRQLMAVLSATQEATVRLRDELSIARAARSAADARAVALQHDLAADRGAGEATLREHGRRISALDSLLRANAPGARRVPRAPWRRRLGA
jgi:DNA recombination protein RmuC